MASLARTERRAPPSAATTIPSSARASRWIQAAFVVLGVAGVALASLALYGTHSAHFQHHAARVLAAASTASALHVEIYTTSTAEPSLVASGELFARRERTAPGAVAFDGRVTYTDFGLTYNTAVVDGRAFLTIENTTAREIVHDGCLAPSDLPPLHSLPGALRDVRVVDQAPVHGVSQASCVASGDHRSRLVEMSFAGETYVFCSHADDRLDTVYGDHVKLVFSRSTATHGQQLSRPGGASLDACKLLSVQDDGISTPPTRSASLARALSSVASRSLDAAHAVLSLHRKVADDTSATTCKDGMKKCLFVHGLGQKPGDALLVDSFSSSWGDAHTKLRCCSETKFVRMDTVHNAWHSDVLATQFCEAAQTLTHSADPMALEDLAVLSHSMGNLIVASAAMTGRCAIGPSSKWIALAGPMRGSYSANLGIKVCVNDENAGDDTAKTDATALDKALTTALTAVDVCPALNATRSLAFQGSELARASLDALFEQAQATFGRLVTASLCGTSGMGLPTIFSTWYSTLGELAEHTSPNDGAVEIDSCRGPIPEAKYSTSWRGGRFYKAQLNHADVTMRNGDGLWGEDRQPSGSTASSNDLGDTHDQYM